MVVTHWQGPRFQLLQRCATLTFLLCNSQHSAA